MRYTDKQPKNHKNNQQNPQTRFGNFVEEHGGHRAKKAMGQNFLKSKEALMKMCKAGDVKNTDIIVEIGPGKGALTEKLLEKAGLVIAIEKDRDLIDVLQEKFAGEINNYNKNSKNNQQNPQTRFGNLEGVGEGKVERTGRLLLINEDILGFDPEKYDLKEGGYKIIANIPYNITGSIIRRFLSEVKKPSVMTLLVQKEVAERIVSRDGKESILSLSVKAYGTPKYIMKVHKRFFSPEPKVDSAIISINDISGKLFKDKSKEDVFFKTIKAGFLHKRKVLRKNLEEIEGNLNKIDKIFENLNINVKTRAEDVTFQKWLQISELL